MIRLLVLILIVTLILAAVCNSVAVSVAPGGPLYAYGNVRSSRVLTAFGFTRPIPEKFLQPVGILLRLFPGNNTDSDETLRKNAQGPGYHFDFEYMPDKTYITIWRTPARGTVIPQTTSPTFIDDDMGIFPVGVPPFQTLVQQIAGTKTLHSQKKIAGYTYDCYEADFASEEGRGASKFHGLHASRNLKSADQIFSIDAVTPGPNTNMTAINQLLDCMSVE